MRDKGLLVAAVVTIAVGVLGISAAGAWLLAERFGGDARTGSPETRPDERSGPRDTTTSPFPGPPGRRGPFPDDGTIDSLGERIWFTGVGTDGAVPRDPAFGPAMMGGCATCHGEDGRGLSFRMMGRSFEAPDIRYSTLTSEHEEDGEAHEPWTDEGIATAVREGVEPDGEQLERTMPRWDLSDEEMDAVIAHLKTLDR